MLCMCTPWKIFVCGIMNTFEWRLVVGCLISQLSRFESWWWLVFCNTCRSVSWFQLCSKLNQGCFHIVSVTLFNIEYSHYVIHSLIPTTLTWWLWFLFEYQKYKSVVTFTFSICLSDEFRSFALTHPEYAKLFTTYIELQRYQGLQGEELDFDASLSQCCTASHNNHQEDSTSDKKDDWQHAAIRFIFCHAI